MELPIIDEKYIKENNKIIKLLFGYIIDEYSNYIPNKNLASKIYDKMYNMNVMEIESKNNGLLKYLLQSMNDINITSISKYKRINTWSKIENISLDNAVLKYKPKLFMIYNESDIEYIIENNIYYESIIFFNKYNFIDDHPSIFKKTICDYIMNDNNSYYNDHYYYDYHYDIGNYYNLCQYNIFHLINPKNKDLNINILDSDEQKIFNKYFGYTGLYKLKNDRNLLKAVKNIICTMINFKNEKDKTNIIKKLLNYFSGIFKDEIISFNENIKSKKNLIYYYIYYECMGGYINKEYTSYIPNIKDIEYLVNFIGDKKVLQLNSNDYGFFAYLLRAYNININILDIKSNNNIEENINYWVNDIKYIDKYVIDIEKDIYKNIDILLIYCGNNYYDVFENIEKFKGDYIILIKNDYYPDDLYFYPDDNIIDILKNKDKFKLISTYNIINSFYSISLINNKYNENKIKIYSPKN